MEFFFNPNTESSELPEFCEELGPVNVKFSGEDVTREVNLACLIQRQNVHTWHMYWIGQFWRWLLDLGLSSENLRLREHDQSELSHYSCSTFDIEYRFPFGETHGYKELCGIANRGDYDIQQHAKKSKKNLKFKCPLTGEKLFPHVIEPSIGVERLFMAILAECWEYNVERKYIVLHLQENLSPVQFGVFPIPSKDHPKDRYLNKAREVFDNLISKGYRAMYDDGGSIGRRYARHDEMGTKWCVTVDNQTLQDNTVTIRDRDNKVQYRKLFTEIRET